MDPLSMFAEAEQANKTKSTAAPPSAFEIMSRIGASASDLFAESLSFGDPVGQTSSSDNNINNGNNKGKLFPSSPESPSIMSKMSSMAPTSVVQHRRAESWEHTLPGKQTHTTVTSDSDMNSSYSSSSGGFNQLFEGGMTPLPRRSCNGGSGDLTDICTALDDMGSIELKLLVGEHKLMNINDARIQLAPGRLISGVLMMTSYRVVFVPAPTHLAAIAATNPSIYSYLNLPLGCIERIEREKKAKDGRSNAHVTIVISCKDMRVFRVTLMCDSSQSGGMGEYELEKALRLLTASAFPNNRTLMFAFSYSLPSEPLSLALVEPYDTVQEFSRMGILDISSVYDDLPVWRISAVNADYRLCNTYPQLLVVPRKISDDELVLVSHFRSGHRLPVMCWGDRDNGATMWRSSQPKAGVSGSCMQDEKLLDLIAQSCVYRRTPTGVVKMSGDPLLHIFDCRPKASALANRATGAGYESQTSYPNTRIEFCNIGNIHVMRDSYRNLASVLLSPVPAGNDIDFSKQIEATQWLTHVRLVLKCSWDTAQMLRRGIPVLVHCSHGWDRTAQVCALAQLFLDPFYRTFDGFKVLVEKEWCSFGHQFPMRCAHGLDKASRQEDQISPIFLQFLDCVWQLLKQHPHFFEFNARYVLTVADHVHSGRFGTFLFGSDLERDKYDSRHCCVDVWTYLHYNRAALINPLYMDPNLENTPTTHTLLPPLTQLLRNVALWTDYYFRWSALPSALSAPERLHKHLHESGLMLPRHSIPDMDLLAVATSDDFWEGAFRREQCERRLAHAPALGETSTSSGSRGGGGNGRRGGDGSGSENGDGSGCASSVIIDRLVEMLRAKGVAESEIIAVLAPPPNGIDGTTGTAANLSQQTVALGSLQRIPENLPPPQEHKQVLPVHPPISDNEETKEQ